jgi:isoamylase
MRSQQGNNNAYCQDNDISWFDWTAVSRHQDLVGFVRKAIAFTRRFPILQRRKHPLGKDLHDDQVPDLTWFAPDLGWPPWDDPDLRTICVQLDASVDRGVAGGADRLFFILNAHPEWQWVKVPALPSGRRWFRAIDTSLTGGAAFMGPGAEVRLDPPDHYIVNPRTTVVLLAR